MKSRTRRWSRQTNDSFLPDSARAQAAAVWNLDSFTATFLSFPVREGGGAGRPLAGLVVRVDDAALETLSGSTALRWMPLLKAGLGSPSC